MSWFRWILLALVAGLFALFAYMLSQPKDDFVESAMVGEPIPPFDLPPAVADRPGLSSADLADGQPLEFTLVDRGGKISATNIRIEGEPMPVERGGGAAAGGDRGPQRQLTGEKAQGTVKFFNAMKGFGFIQRDDGQPDAFVHISAVERAGIPTLNEGDRLSFELEVDRRGKTAAVNLQPIG